MARFLLPAMQFFVHALIEQLVRTDGEACDSAALRDLFLETRNWRQVHRMEGVWVQCDMWRRSNDTYKNLYQSSAV